MDIANIRTFLKVAELRSFSRAADALGYAQPTVSTQIAKLEHELGQSLFERMGHRISLTEHGQTFLPYAQQVILLTEQVTQEFQGTSFSRSTLKIGIADSLCSSFLSSYLLTYRKEFPGVSVVICTGTTDALIDKLCNNEVDMVYTLDNRISRSDLIVQQEQVEQIHFCANASHPLLCTPEITWSNIKRYPLYLTEAGVSYRYNLERLLGEMGEELRPAIELGNVQTILQLVCQSDGIAFLPEFVIQKQSPDGNVAFLPVKDIRIKVWRQLIYHKGKFLTPAMKGMLDLLHKKQV